MSDDGVGMRVGRILAKSELDPHIDLRLCPALGLDLLDSLDDVERVVIVDAMRTGRAAGDCVVLDVDQTVASCQGGASAHSYGVAEIVEIARRLGLLQDNTRVCVVGVEAEVLDRFGTVLSASVRDAIPRAIETCLRAAGASEERLAASVGLAKSLSGWDPSPQELALPV